MQEVVKAKVHAPCSALFGLTLGSEYRASGPAVTSIVHFGAVPVRPFASLVACPGLTKTLHSGQCGWDTQLRSSVLVQVAPHGSQEHLVLWMVVSGPTFNSFSFVGK